MDPANRAVLITGCDTGFGFALAKHLHNLGTNLFLFFKITVQWLQSGLITIGFVVFAGCLMKDQGGDGVKQLNDEGQSTGRLFTVQMNVTSDEQVEEAVKTVRAQLPSNVKVILFLIELLRL